MTIRMYVVGAACLVAASVASGQPLTLQNATATVSQSVGGIPWNVSGAINGVIIGGVDGWAIFNGGTGPETAVFEFASNLSAPAVVLDLHQMHNNQGHMLGCFRISFTTDDRESFADGLQSGGDVSANWTVVAPSLVSVPAGTTWSLRGDDAVLIGGVNAGVGVYSLTLPLPAADITGLRLEVLEDASLPTSGPGRFASNGNFVLSELTATAVPAPSAAISLGVLGAAALVRRRR
jgi:hypothetical protein